MMTSVDAVESVERALDTFKPPDQRTVIPDDHPVIRFATASADSIRQAGKDILSEATDFDRQCAEFANSLEEGAKSFAAEAQRFLEKIRSAGLSLKQAREDYSGDRAAPAEPGARRNKRSVGNGGPTFASEEEVLREP